MSSVDSRSYYGQPVLKEPVWTPEIPVYFFTGGLGGASAGLAFLSELRGNDQLARRAWAASFAGLAVSPPLLISDLGVPRRFLNMLRMFKVTSPMSVGSWLLTAAAPVTGVARTSPGAGSGSGASRAITSPDSQCFPATWQRSVAVASARSAMTASYAAP